MKKRLEALEARIMQAVEEHPEKALATTILIAFGIIFGMIIVGSLMYGMRHPESGPVSVRGDGKVVSVRTRFASVGAEESFAPAIALPVTFVAGGAKAPLVRVSVVCTPGSQACYGIEAAALTSAFRSNEWQTEKGGSGFSDIACVIEVMERPIASLDSQPYRYQMACKQSSDGEYWSKTYFRTSIDVSSKLRTMLRDPFLLPMARKKS